MKKVLQSLIVILLVISNGVAISAEETLEEEINTEVVEEDVDEEEVLVEEEIEEELVEEDLEESVQEETTEEIIEEEVVEIIEVVAEVEKTDACKYAKIKTTEKSINGFTVRMYRLVLGREPDDTGFKNWTTALKNKDKTAAEIIVGFFKSKELKGKNLSDKEYLKLLYKTVMNRDADEAGLNNWLKKIKEGYNEDEILQGFVGSKEFTELCKNYGIERGSILVSSSSSKTKVVSFVKRLYNKCLSREPDTTGLNNWVNRLVKKEISGGEAAYGFFNSQEFTSKNLTNKEIVTLLYNTILDRNPDSTGLNNWVNYLDKGVSLNFVLKGFVASTEYKNLCKKYGIDNGTIKLTAYRDLNPSITMYVSDLYYEAIGKRPAVKTLENYVKKLVTKKTDLMTLAKSIYTSKSCTKRSLSDDDFIKAVFMGILQKEPTSAELKKYRKALTSGNTREELVKAIVNTNDAYNKSRSLGINYGGTAIGKEIVKLARSWVGVGVYAYGGNNPATGADCSGFVQYVYKQVGIDVPHSTTMIIEMATPISEKEAKPGDLIMWTGHASIYTGEGTSIHAMNPYQGIRELNNSKATGSGQYMGYYRVPGVND